MSNECLLCRNEVVNDTDPWMVSNDHFDYLICDECMNAILNGELFERLLTMKPCHKSPWVGKRKVKELSEDEEDAELCNVQETSKQP